MVSGASSPLQVVDAMKSGATHFIGKPINHDELSSVLNSAIQAQAVSSCIEPLDTRSGKGGQSYIGSSPKMRELQALVSRVGWSEAPVLIQGETGSGKEVLARQLHALSPRAHKPFLKLNCAALPSELVESELFGYERGAFTGAVQRKPGMFEYADSGTLLLDEIGDMDVKLQAKLLQVLQDHEFQRLGGKETIRVDVRVIAATHRDLEKAIEAGDFRGDLYYRLNVINLRVPALRERQEDITRLAEFLLRKHHPAGTSVPVIPENFQKALLQYDWPGNVRELENVMRRVGVLGDFNQMIDQLGEKASQRKTKAEATPQGRSRRAGDEPADSPILEQVTKAKESAETEAILAALKLTSWNRKQAAALLKIDYKALLYKMKKLSIEDKPVLRVPVGETHGNAGGVSHLE
jgi:two-component system response regulator AtoC